MWFSWGPFSAHFCRYEANRDRGPAITGSLARIAGRCRYRVIQAMNRNQVISVLRGSGFEEGRMISHSKTGYCRRNRNNFVVFNAQVFTTHGRVLRQVDLDLTRDGDKLNEAARLAGRNFFVLYERDPTPFWKPGDTSISAVLREAVWWTRFRACDQDRFRSLNSGPIWKMLAHLKCSTGKWHGQPAFSVDLWQNSKWESR